MKGYRVPKGPPHLAGAEGAGGVKRVRKGLSRGHSDPMIEASWQSGGCNGRAAVNEAVHCHPATRTYTLTLSHSQPGPATSAKLREAEKEGEATGKASARL